jgi:hypothetical protein
MSKRKCNTKRSTGKRSNTKRRVQSLMNNFNQFSFWGEVRWRKARRKTSGRAVR